MRLGTAIHPLERRIVQPPEKIQQFIRQFVHAQSLEVIITGKEFIAALTAEDGRNFAGGISGNQIVERAGTYQQGIKRLQVADHLRQSLQHLFKLDDDFAVPGLQVLCT